MDFPLPLVYSMSLLCFSRMFEPSIKTFSIKEQK